MDHIKYVDQADLNSPRRELSNRGLGIVVTLLVFFQTDFLGCVSLTFNPAVSSRTLVNSACCKSEVSVCHYTKLWQSSMKSVENLVAVATYVVNCFS